MKINAFFANRLRTPLYNHVWSWGAFDSGHNRVFLRVVEEDVVTDEKGMEWVVVYNPDWNASSGHSERLRHIDAIRSGAVGYAVTVQFNDLGNIAAFNDETLLRLGEIVEENGLTYAQVIGEIPIEDVTEGESDHTSTGRDIEAIIASKAKLTERKALVDARLGQGTFRQAVLRQWDYRCSVTGIAVAAAIRASHIKPWKTSSNFERLDPFNGLPLVATVDALFDGGLISFQPSGEVLLSSQLSPEDRKQLGLSNLRLRKAVSKLTAAYLKYHHQERFRP
jgi:putative restriction endonuclease